MKMVEVCEHMGWTEEQYWNASTLFLRLLDIKMLEDADYQRSKNK